MCLGVVVTTSVSQVVKGAGELTKGGKARPFEVAFDRAGGAVHSLASATRLQVGEEAHKPSTVEKTLQPTSAYQHTFQENLSLQHLSQRVSHAKPGPV